MGKIRGIKNKRNKTGYTMTLKENRHQLLKNRYRKLLILSVIINIGLLLTTFRGIFSFFGV